MNITTTPDVIERDVEQAKSGEAAYIAGMLAEALRHHRADMHATSNRPCSTCQQSAKALARYDEWLDQ